MLLALLLPDPCDEQCPQEFKQRVRNILPRVQGKPGSSDDELRAALLQFIGNLSSWDNSSNATLLDAARGLVKAAYGDEAPLVVDPFSGGGSIPLEALRIGCDAFASDLNPVACLILKTMLEDIPRLGPTLSVELRQVATAIRKRAESELGELYPSGRGENPIAYIWVRTVQCDSCGAEIPLLRSMWLSTKAKSRTALRPVVVKHRGSPPEVKFEIYEPKSDRDVAAATVKRANAICVACGVVLPATRVRVQLQAKNGGTDDARMVAVVVTKPGQQGRFYRLPTARDLEVFKEASERLRKREATASLSKSPDEPIPLMSGTFNVPLYGVTRWGDMFNARQKLALLTLADVIKSLEGVSSAAKEIASLALSRFTDICNAFLMWSSNSTQTIHLFSRQALPMVWDFPEPAIFGDAGGDYGVTLGTMIRVIDALGAIPQAGTVKLADACSSPLPDESADVWFTDPPYYFAVPYADLSDFFFVWLKRTLPNHPLLRDPFDASNPLTPKAKELCEMAHWDSVRYPNKDKLFFESGMNVAFREGRRVLTDNGIGCVVFAHKTTEGWEALLSGMINGGWVITASWPISTERPDRLRSRDSAALATSVHLVCRPRPEDAGVGDWAHVLRELPHRVGEWVERLQEEGIRGADLVFACIGPAMEVYSRYRRVEDAEGREIPLGGDPTASEPYKRGFLAYVWETVGRLALEQVLGTAEARARNGGAGALEEDSRLTALFLWTLQTTEATTNGDANAVDDQGEDEEDDDEEKPKKKKAGFTLIYDVARRFAQPLGIHLDKWEGRIIETEKGVVRLLPVGERAMQLFGDADASAISRRIEQDVKASRNYAFAFMQDVAAAPEIKPRGRGRAVRAGVTVEDAPVVQTVTTLDRVHAAMLLQASGQANGLRAMLKEEQQRGPDFLRLANALSALYPKDSEEKRLLDAMLLAVPR
jgi:adenine-specific DNA methylase